MLFYGLSCRMARRGPQAWLAAGALLALLLLALAALPGRVLAAPVTQGASPGETLFQTKCVACHTIGKGKLVGPDLQDVTARRDAAWLKQFIADPNKLFDANDPTAQQLLAENNNVRMPALGLTDAEISAVVAFLGTGPTAASAPAAAALPPGDPAAGWRSFTGTARLTGGGPACIGCHSVSGLGGLGGGALGPDLTHVVQRYPGAGLAAVLGNIAFPTMSGPFTNRPLTPQEQADLVAYLTAVDQNRAAPPVTAGALTQNTALVLGIGLAGTVALLVVLAFFWPRQRQSVSSRLRNAQRRVAQ